MSILRIVIWFFLALAGVLLLGGFALWYRAPDCFVADINDVLRTDVRLGSKTYSLVRRVSGFHDKVELFLVYEGVPSFDVCGATSLQPIATESVEAEKGAVREIVLRDGRLEIRYGLVNRNIHVQPETPALRIE